MSACASRPLQGSGESCPHPILHHDHVQRPKQLFARDPRRSLPSRPTCERTPAVRERRPPYCVHWRADLRARSRRAPVNGVRPIRSARTARSKKSRDSLVEAVSGPMTGEPDDSRPHQAPSRKVGHSAHQRLLRDRCSRSSLATFGQHQTRLEEGEVWVFADDGHHQGPIEVAIEALARGLAT